MDLSLSFALGRKDLDSDRRIASASCVWTEDIRTRAEVPNPFFFEVY